MTSYGVETCEEKLTKEWDESWAGLLLGWDCRFEDDCSRRMPTGVLAGSCNKLLSKGGEVWLLSISISGLSEIFTMVDVDVVVISMLSVIFGNGGAPGGP